MGNHISECVPCGPSDSPEKEVRVAHAEADEHKQTLRLPLLRVVFEAMDEDKSGFIEADEMANFGQYTGNRDWTPEQIDEMFKKMDVNNDGKISMEEFQDFAHEQTAHHSSERFQAMIQGFIEVGNLVEERKAMIESVYKKIDTNNRGTVTRDEMMEFGRFMNSKFDEEKLNKLMDQMDLDKDGLISFHEFLAYFAKLSKPIEDASFSKGIQRYLKFQKTGVPTEGADVDL